VDLQIHTAKHGYIQTAFRKSLGQALRAQYDFPDWQGCSCRTSQISHHTVMRSA
jgi:hypothetical protein